MKIDELHDKLFKMWRMFDEICKANNITYFFDSGSLLGAVREHDFIPWDDDIDVAVEREEYERLKKVFNKCLPAKYKFIEPKDFAPYFFDFVPKLIDTTVPLRSETAEDRAYHNYQNRMSIDFFILDSVPNAKWRQSFIRLKSKVFYGFARSNRYAIHEADMSFSEKALSRTAAVLGKCISLNRALSLYEHNTTRFADIQSDYFIRSNSLLYFIDFYKKSDYAGVVYLPFHGDRVPAPVGYDAILKQMYGDYMTPKRHYKGYISHTDPNGN
ncbi:MAG: LicD family protein [Oscillospiraceae bacterium]|nr:LicD family protein [Oscillospiraceae bacterium]